MKNRTKVIDTDLIVLCFICIVFFIFQIWDIYSGYYSAIGDEYAFYVYGKGVASGGVKIALTHLFSQDGVYGIIPVLSGVYQGLIMKIVGINVLGWKSAQIVIIIASIFPLFYLVRSLWDRLTAFTTVVLLLSSHYIWAYIKTGYCNLEAIFPTVCSIFFLNRALKLESRASAFLAGMMAGLGFMTFYSSRVTLFIICSVGLVATLKKKSFHLVAWMLIGFSLIYIPFVLINGDRVYKAMFDESFISSNEQRSISRVKMIPQNAYINARAFFMNTQSGPYVSGSLIDPISGFLASIGLLIVIIRMTRYRNYLIMLWLLWSFLTTGVFSKFSYPAISRLNYLIPVTALLGGVAATTIAKKFNNNLRVLIVSSLLIPMIGLNVYRFYVTTPRKYPISRETSAILAFQKVCSDKKTIIIDQDPVPVLIHALDAYGLANVKSQKITNPQIIPKEYDCYIVSNANHITDTKMDVTLTGQYQKIDMVPTPDGIHTVIYKID